MTLLQYVQSLQDQGATDIAAKVEEWKKKNQPKVEVEEVEEVKTEVVPGKVAPVATATENATDIEDTELPLEDGSLESLEIEPSKQKLKNKYRSGFNDVFENLFGMSIEEDNQKNKEYKQKQIDEYLKQFKPGTQERAYAYYINNITPDSTVNSEFFDQIPEMIKLNENNDKINKELSNYQNSKIFGGYEDRVQGIIPPIGWSEQKGREEAAIDYSTQEGYTFGDSVKERAMTKMVNENFDLDNPYIYYGKNQELNPDGAYFSSVHFGGVDKIEALEINPIDFEGYIIKSEQGKRFEKNEKEGLYNGETGALQKETDLQYILLSYITDSNNRYNEKIHLKNIMLNPDDYKDFEGKQKLNKYGAYGLPKAKNNYTKYNPKLINEYLKETFPRRFELDKKYEQEIINEYKYLEEKGDWASALSNPFQLIKEGASYIEKFGADTVDGFHELYNFMYDVTGFDATAERSRFILNERKRKKAFQNNHLVLLNNAKTLKIDGVEYAKDKDTGSIYNVDVGYSVNGIKDPLEIKYISDKLEEDGIEKNHTGLRGMANTGINVFAQFVPQIIGTKGFSLLGKGASLTTGSILNGFGLNVGKFKKFKDINALMGGKANDWLRIPMPKAVTNDVLFQGVYGASMMNENIIREGQAAGLTDDEISELTSYGRIMGFTAYALTGNVARKGKLLDDILGNFGIKAAVKGAVEGFKKQGPKSFFASIEKWTTNIIKNSPKFVNPGFNELAQEQTQQFSETLINKYLNTSIAPVDFLDDTYTQQDFILTSVLSFASGGIISNLRIPSFKSSKNSLENLKNYQYIADNASESEKILADMVANGTATQDEMDLVLSNAKAINNQSSKIPTIVSSDYVLEFSVMLQEIQELEAKKKDLAVAFHPEIDGQIKTLEEASRDLVEQAVVAKTNKLTEGAKTIAGQTRTEFIDAETQEEVDIEIKKLQDRGGKIDEKNSSDYGTFVTLEDGSKIIILNKESAKEDLVMTTANHETGHSLLYETFKNRPEVAIAFGKAVLLEIESNKNLTFNNDQFKIDLMRYVNDSNYSEAGVAEEIMTLLSEGLSNDWVTFNETGLTKIGDIIRKSLSALGVKVRFNKGSDIINFIRDYNQSIESNSGLSLGMQKTALEGGKGKLTNVDKDSNQKIRENIKQSYNGKITVLSENGSLESIDIESFNPDSQQVLEVDDNFRSSKKRASSLALKYKQGKITENEMNDFYNEYILIALSPSGLAFDSRIKLDDKEAINRDEAKSFVSELLPDIMKRWNPDKEANISTWITANVRPKRADFYGKEQKLDEKGKQTSTSDERLKEIASETSSQPRIADKKTKTVDIRKFNVVKPKVEEIEKSVVIKPEQVTSLTYKNVADNYIGPIGKVLTGLSAAKITGNETLNYGIQNNDASKLQRLFQNTQEVVDFIAAMPKFNVATNESIINEQGEIIDATSDAKGYSLGINPSLIKKYYKRFTDPTGKMTSKSGRSKGKTSQPNVFKLDFAPTVANARKLQKDIGITPSGEMNVPIKGPTRTEFGTTLQGLSKMYVSNLANTIARKKAKELLKTLKTAKDPKKIIADIGAGKSDALASKKRGTRDFNTIVREAGGKALNSKNLNVDSSKMPKIILDYLKNNPITVLDENENDITESWTENLEKNLDRLFKSKENFKDFDEKFSEIKQKYPELNKKKIKDAITKSFFSTIKANSDVLEYRKFVREKLFPVFPKSFFTSGTFAGAGTAGPSRNFFYYSIGDLDLDNNKFAAEDSDIAAAVTRVGYTTGSGELRKITESWYTNEFLTGNQDVLNKKKLIGLKKIFKVFETLLKDKNNVPFVAALLSSTSQGMGGFVRAAAPITFVGNNLINGIVEEHTMPASFVAKYLFEAALNGTVDTDFKNINKNYQQGALGKLDDNKLKGFNNGVRFNYTQKMPDGWKFSDSVWNRYFNLNTASQDGGIDGRDYTMADGKTLFETLNVTSSGLKVDVKTVSSMKRAQISNSNISNVVNKNHNTQKQVNTLENIDKALAKGRSLNTPEKGISVFDFDDTLAKTNSKVIVTMPESTQSITNTGDAKKVINTVYKSVINSVANNSNINTISFSSEFNEQSRVKLYNSLADKLSKELGWELDVFETVDSTGNTDVVTSEDFTLTKGKDAKKIKGDKNAIKFKKDVADNLKSSFNINRKTYDVSLDFIGKGDYNLEFSLRGKTKGKTYKINATEFAKQSIDLEAQGAKFNFDEFSKVIDGKKGPLFDLAQKRKGKFGNKDIFILTARPQLAAPEIYEFLKKIGLEIPLANITGLENGSPQAKADWIIGKAAKGYNNFYFADDAIKNVKAVKNVLEQIDVKSKVQLALASKKRTFDDIFNNIIESSTGIKNYKTYSEARAKVEGKKNNKTTFFIPPSAEDFTGLLYRMLGKGKVGDAQFQFFKDNLLDPYNRAEIAVTQAKISAANDFKALKKNLKTLPKKLSKQTGVGKFSFGQAVRVAIWTRQGMKIPGLSKTDANKLNAFINKNKELSMFVNELINIQKGKPYPEPGDNWTAGTIISDITNGINKVNRKEYLQEFIENSDIIFSDKNMNKLQAAYGSKYIEALRDSLRRMKSGSNRPIGGSRVVNEVLDWLNNSVGTVMFLNRRSGILQTISSVNFIDFGDNNIFKAGKALANQPQFWSDFMTLINSPYLVERRDGLKINVSESEIADAVAESDNKVKAAISYLLNKGFVFTRYADSFAIASGGATFYRNRLEALKKKGMTEEQAKKQAFEDFRAIAETNQQSSSPSKISQQQASAAGRVILAFANTPMQYARIQKRAIQDLIAGRGDWKSNISKITYYGIIQNLIFNALQNALFLMLFDDEDEEQESKTGRIANGMADSLLRGLGIQGAAVSALKNVLLKIGEENKKKSTKYREAVFEAFDFSPPLDSKVRKLRSAGQTFDWNMKEIKQEGFNLNNPAYLAGGQIISSTTNIPVDRAVSDINALRQIFSNNTENWQKVALALGWSTWDVGLPYYGVKKEPIDTPQTRLKNKVDLMKKETNTKEQKQMLLDLGLSRQEIINLKYENKRVQKIIELQKSGGVKKIKTPESELKRQFDSIKDENKPDQVKTLLGFGLTKAEIRKLKYEKDRVEKILELMKNKK